MKIPGFRRPRWASRPDPRITVSETVEIERPPEDVMAFLLDPESATAIDRHVVRASRAPDAPVGAVGEQHVLVLAEPGGGTHVDVEEVVELDLPHRIVTRCLTVAGDLRVTYTCEPTDTGTAYTQEVSITVHDSRERRLTHEAFVEETRRSTARIKEVLEAPAPG